MARKSRQNRYFPQKNKAKWKAGVYARLSVSDNRVYGESHIYQLKLTQEARLSKPDISFVKNYVDDGYSGMHFNRPAFQSMLEDLKYGIINCVIVKDVSRIGRDYLGICQLLQETFPSMGVRFISINDNYDNVSDVRELIGLEMVVKTIMHYGTAIDISKKVKSAIDAESFDLLESVYMPNAQKMRKKQLDIQACCEALIDEDHELTRILHDSNQRLELCKQYAKSPKLTGELLDSLIDRIAIYADKRICVHFKYNDECYQEMYSGRV